MARRTHRRDHRGRQQGGDHLAVRLAVDPSRRRAVVDQGDALLPARALRAAARAGLGVGRLLRRCRRPPGAPRGDAVVLLRRRGASPRAMRDRLVEPARARRAPRAGEPGHLVLHLPEGAAALPRRLPDRPTTSPPPTGSAPTTSSTPRTRSTWRSAAAATPTSCPAWLDTLGTERVHVDRLRSASSTTRRRTLRDHGHVARARPAPLPGRRAQLREPHHRVQEQGVPAGRARGQRPARAGAPPPSRRQAQAPRRSTTG